MILVGTLLCACEHARMFICPLLGSSQPRHWRFRCRHGAWLQVCFAQPAVLISNSSLSEVQLLDSISKSHGRSS